MKYWGRVYCTADTAPPGTVLDDCGVPDGDNSFCSDDCGVPFGDNSSCEDVCGVPNGDDTSCEDQCGVPNGNDESCQDGTCGCLLPWIGYGFCDFYCGGCPSF